MRTPMVLRRLFRHSSRRRPLPALAFGLVLWVGFLYSGEPEAPSVRIGRCAAAPRIDGRLEPDEWTTAAGVSGLVLAGTQELVAVQPHVRLAFDDQALYIAVTVPTPGTKPVQAQRRTRDSQVYLDDSVEILLDPGQSRRDFFHVIVNSAGALYDAHGTDATWNAPTAQAAGSAEAGQWHAEVMLPFADLGVTAPPDGAAWGANLCLNCAWDTALLGSWAPVQAGYREPARFGRLEFDRRGPAASWQGAADLFVGQGAIAVNTSGPAPSRCELRLWPAADNAAEPIRVERTGTGAIALPFALPGLAAQNSGKPWRARLAVEQDGRALLTTAFQFTPTAPVTCNVRAYVRDRLIEAEVIPGAALARRQGLAATVALAARGGATIRTIALPGLTPLTPALATFSGDDVAADAMTLTIRVADQDGTTIFETTREIAAPFRPWWLDDTTGADEVVLPPYKSLRVNGADVLPDGRSYRLGDCLLPVDVQIGGNPILAAPVVLRARLGGQPRDWDGAAPTIREQNGHHVVMEGTATCGGLVLAGRARIEYDGMIRTDLEIRPAGATDEVAVEALTLEIPLHGRYAEYLYTFPGKWGSVANAGALPAAGARHGFKPFVWLGDNDRGFAWFCESAQHWLPEDREDAITVDREGDRVVLRLRLLAGVRVKAPLRYTFGFQATPVKSPEKTVWDYRPFHISQYGLQNRPAPISGHVSYPAAGAIRGDRGTAEMWVQTPCDSDPKGPGKGDLSIPNVGLMTIEVEPKTNAGLFWCGPAQALRIWSRLDDRVVTSLEAPVTWKQGEWHHLAFSWGEELVIAVDGVALARRPYAGLMPRDLTTARLAIGRPGPPLAVDEIRVSDIARAPRLEEQPYAPDEHTLLLDPLDAADVTDRARLRQTRPSRGPAPGEAGGGAFVGEGRFGKGLVLRPRGAEYSFLDFLADYGVRTLCFHSQWSWMGYPMVPPGQEQDLRDLVAACHRKGMQLLLYASPLSADEAPEWAMYHKDYLIEPLTWPYRYRDAHIAPAACWQSHYRNLWLARQARLIDEFDIDGFYLDGSEWPLWCRNRHHGCGYTREDGKTGDTCNIFGTRDYMKRLYVLCRSRKPDAQINIHNSTVMVIPTLGWGTSSWDGEQLGSLSWDKGGAVDKMQYALDVLPLDAFRAEFMGRQWGVPAEFLCYQRPYTTPQILAVTLLHDVLVRPSADYLPMVSELWRLYDRFGMKDAEFLPYWSNAAVIKAGPEGIRTSAYRHPRNGLLMVVSNLAAAAITAEVQIDTAALGLTGAGLAARDALSEEPIALTGGRFTLSMEPMSYRWVRLAAP